MSHWRIMVDIRVKLVLQYQTPLVGLQVHPLRPQGRPTSVFAGSFVQNGVCASSQNKPGECVKKKTIRSSDETRQMKMRQGEDGDRRGRRRTGGESVAAVHTLTPEWEKKPKQKPRGGLSRVRWRRGSRLHLIQVSLNEH